MNFDFLSRIQQELRVTLTAAEETVLAVAERVNRKVQLLRLHWRASQLHGALATVHYKVGQQLTEALVRPPSVPEHPISSDSLLRGHPHLGPLLSRSCEQARSIKDQLDRISSRIVSMQSEAIREDLLRFTRELEFRGVTLQYFYVTRGAPMVGRSLRDAGVQTGAHLVGLLRGPLVLPPQADEVLQPNDGILMLGTPEALAACTRSLSSSSAYGETSEEELIGRASHA